MFIVQPSPVLTPVSTRCELENTLSWFNYWREPLTFDLLYQSTQTTTWDVGVITIFCWEIRPQRITVSWKDLSQNFGILLILTAVDRVSEVHLTAHDLRFRQFSPEGVFQLPQLTKKTKVGQSVKTSLPFMTVSPPLCCAMFVRVHVWKTHIEIPCGFDLTRPNRLLLSYTCIRPHEPTTSESLLVS